MRKLNASFFESKVRHEAVLEDGTQAKVVECYAVDAISFTECEARVTEFMGQYVSGEFEVLTESHAPYSDILRDEESDKFYKVNANFITLNEKTNKEKKTKYVVLVEATSIDDARKKFDEFMSGSMVDYVITAVSESNVMGVVEKREEK